MAQLTRRDVSDAVRVIAAIDAASHEVRAFARAAVDGLHQLVPSELTTLSDCDLAAGRRRVVSTPPNALSASDLGAFDRHFHEHPLVDFHSTHPRAGTARITDTAHRVHFRDSGLYNDYYRRIGIDHVVAVPLRVDGGRLVSIVLNRARRDFSDRECELLDWVRAGVAGVYQTACATNAARASFSALAALAEYEGWHAVTIDARFAIECLPRPAARLLAQAVPGARARVGALLPAAIAACIDANLRAPLRVVNLALARPLRLLLQPRPGGGWILWLRQGGPNASAPMQSAVALTPREGEVLCWLVAGKTNAQIAAVLGAAPRTVHKHLERIYGKLGVETRTAAAMRALALGMVAQPVSVR